MVALSWLADGPLMWIFPVLLAAEPEPNKPSAIWHRLSREQQAKLLMVLMGLLLLAFIVLLVISVGARTVRRFARQGNAPTSLDADDWARKPLVSGPRDEEDDAPAGEVRT